MKRRLIKEEMNHHRLFKRTDDFPKGARPGYEVAKAKILERLRAIIRILRQFSYLHQQERDQPQCRFSSPAAVGSLSVSGFFG